MISTGIWRKYIPTNPPVENVIYAQDAKGNDWYEFLDKFSTETYKVEFTEEGYISRISKDVTALFPLDRKIAEVKTIPEDIGDINYTFDGKKFSKVIETDDQKIEATKKEMQSRVSSVGGTISSLSALNTAGIADDATKEKLKAYVAYVSKVMNVDLISPEWPKEPSL